jgi:hypothetical protein
MPVLVFVLEIIVLKLDAALLSVVTRGEASM